MFVRASDRQLAAPVREEVTEVTSFLGWRRMRWGFVLWAGYVLFWMVTVDSGVAIAILWWLTGTIVFGSLWLATQPRFRRGRSVGGVFVRPGWTARRFLDFHRTHRAGAQTGFTPSSKSDAPQPPGRR